MSSTYPQKSPTHPHKSHTHPHKRPVFSKICTTEEIAECKEQADKSKPQNERTNNRSVIRANLATGKSSEKKSKNQPKKT